jgi:hypothetical protein
MHYASAFTTQPNMLQALRELAGFSALAADFTFWWPANMEPSCKYQETKCH